LYAKNKKIFEKKWYLPLLFILILKPILTTYKISYLFINTLADETKGTPVECRLREKIFDGHNRQIYFWDCFESQKIVSLIVSSDFFKKVRNGSLVFVTTKEEIFRPYVDSLKLLSSE